MPNTVTVCPTCAAAIAYGDLTAFAFDTEREQRVAQFVDGIGPAIYLGDITDVTATDICACCEDPIEDPTDVAVFDTAA